MCSWHRPIAAVKYKLQTCFIRCPLKQNEAKDLTPAAVKWLFSLENGNETGVIHQPPTESRQGLVHSVGLYPCFVTQVISTSNAFMIEVRKMLLALSSCFLLLSLSYSQIHTRFFLLLCLSQINVKSDFWLIWLCLQIERGVNGKTAHMIISMLNKGRWCILLIFIRFWI